MSECQFDGCEAEGDEVAIAFTGRWESTDDLGTYTTVLMTEPTSVGLCAEHAGSAPMPETFRVLRCTWNDAFTERVILDLEPIKVGAA